MQDTRYAGRLEPGMDVCDVDGQKIGSISRIHRHEAAMAATGASRSGIAMSPRAEILEVQTGLFGLGRHLYIPFSAIQDAPGGCVVVNQPRDRVDDQGWDVKPDSLSS